MKSQWCWSNKIIEFWFNNAICVDYYFPAFLFFRSYSRRSPFTILVASIAVKVKCWALCYVCHALQRTMCSEHFFLFGIKIQFACKIYVRKMKLKSIEICESCRRFVCSMQKLFDRNRLAHFPNVIFMSFYFQWDPFVDLKFQIEFECQISKEYKLKIVW